MPAEKEFKMMPGTQSGPSYMAFARNGGMALGVKFIAIKEGAALGVADTTWIGARLRSAPEGGLFAEENGKVVKLQKYADSPAEAWPEIIWQKADDYRASTVTGVFLRGSFKGSAESRAALLEALAGKKLVNQMVDYLVQVAGIGEFHRLEARSDRVPRQPAVAGNRGDQEAGRGFRQGAEGDGSVGRHVRHAGGDPQEGVRGDQGRRARG